VIQGVYVLLNIQSAKPSDLGGGPPVAFKAMIGIVKAEIF